MEQQYQCFLLAEGLVQFLRNYHFIYSCKLKYLKRLPSIYSIIFSGVLPSTFIFWCFGFLSALFSPSVRYFSLCSLFHHVPSTSKSFTWDTNIMLQYGIIIIGNQAKLFPSSHLQTLAPCDDTASIKEASMTFSMSLALSLNPSCITAFLLMLEGCMMVVLVEIFKVFPTQPIAEFMPFILKFACKPVCQLK